MKKALSVTSPTHGMALAVYFFLGIFGLLGVFGLTNDSAITKAMGEGIGDIWSTTLMIASFGCFFSAIFASRARRPEHHLHTEMLFSLALAVNLGFLMYVVIDNFGLKGAISAFLTSPFVFGALIRAWQIWYERRLIKSARAHPEESEPVMADPRDHHELD